MELFESDQKRNFQTFARGHYNDIGYRAFIALGPNVAVFFGNSHKSGQIAKRTCTAASGQKHHVGLALNMTMFPACHGMFQPNRFALHLLIRLGFYIKEHRQTNLIRLFKQARTF